MGRRRSEINRAKEHTFVLKDEELDFFEKVLNADRNLILQTTRNLMNEHHYYCDDSPTFESKYIPIETLRSKNSQLNDMLPIRLYKKNKDVEVVDIMHVHTGEKIPFPIWDK